MKGELYLRKLGLLLFLVSRWVQVLFHQRGVGRKISMEKRDLSEFERKVFHIIVA